MSDGAKPQLLLRLRVDAQLARLRPVTAKTFCAQHPGAGCQYAERQQETMREREQSKPPCPAPFVEAAPRPRPASSSPNLLEPARPDTFNFRFSADRNFKEKFERLAEVLGVENPLKHMAEILEQAVDISLEKKDPKRKRERRLERQGAKAAPRTRSRPDEQGHRLEPDLSGEKLPGVIKGFRGGGSGSEPRENHWCAYAPGRAWVRAGSLSLARL